MRITLPQLPISKLGKRALKAKYVSVLNCEERVDRSMVDESITNYLLPEVNYKGKVCLDLGANMGAFSQLACDAGAIKSFAVECDRRNFSLMEKSFKDDDDIELIFGAVVGGDEEYVELFKSSSKNSHCSTSTVSKKRFKSYDRVRSINIDKLLERVKPDIVKVDIESAEYSIIDSILKYKPKVLFIELHGYKFKEEMEIYTEKLIELYDHHKIEPLIVFGNHSANDCLFYDD